MPAEVLVADPPWAHDDKLPPSGALKAGRSAGAHYSTMSIDAICGMALPVLRANAVLFLWKVASMPEEALRVCRAWGFVPKSEIVWVKTNSEYRVLQQGEHFIPRLSFGMGRYVRGAHESAIIAVRGKPSLVQPRVRNVRSVFFAPRGEHSAKPDAFYELVERMYAGPYVELFARRQRAGWDCRGEEVGR
jgi:N6-adenosine-specific RNA methylase IME4